MWVPAVNYIPQAHIAWACISPPLVVTAGPANSSLGQSRQARMPASNTGTSRTEWACVMESADRHQRRTESTHQHHNHCLTILSPCTSLLPPPPCISSSSAACGGRLAAGASAHSRRSKGPDNDQSTAMLAAQLRRYALPRLARPTCTTMADIVCFSSEKF